MEKRNTSKLLIGGVLVIIGGALLVWSLTGRDAAAPASESTDGSGTSSAQINNNGSDEDPDQAVSNDHTAEAATIVFTSDGFSPEELEVRLGQTVTVKNESNQRVQYSSDDHPTHRLNEGMNLAILQPGESGTFTAGPVGRHGFHDHIDDSFTGVLIVRE